MQLYLPVDGTRRAFYFLEHEQGKHTLVIADQPVAHPVLPVTPALSYRSGDGSGAGGNVIARLASKREWRPGKYTMNDYNFETPSTNLEVTSASTVEVGGNRRYELYEHPGDYRRKTRGEALPRIRIQEIESISQVVKWDKLVSFDGKRLSFHSDGTRPAGVESGLCHHQRLP
jgi:type VI secretion system secreted protein VgrG